MKKPYDIDSCSTNTKRHWGPKYIPSISMPVLCWSKICYYLHGQWMGYYASNLNVMGSSLGFSYYVFMAKCALLQGEKWLVTCKKWPYTVYDRVRHAVETILNPKLLIKVWWIYNVVVLLLYTSPTYKLTE